MNEYLYQPVIKKADGSTALPEGFYSFMAFRQVNNLRRWMKFKGHKRTNYEVKQYKQDEIEDPTIVDNEIQDTLTIRLKRQKTFHFVEWYDGVRVPAPEGMHTYQTRHSDYDISLPYSILPEGENCIVNFCGTIISTRPIDVTKETKLMFVSMDSSPDPYEVQGLTKCPEGCPGYCLGCRLLATKRHKS